MAALIPGLYELAHPIGFGFGAGNEMAAIARNLVHAGYYGNPFEPLQTGPTAVVPPLYPLYLAAFLAVFGAPLMVAIVCVIGILVNAAIAAMMPRLSLVFYGDATPGVFGGVLWILCCRLLPNWDMNHTIAGLILLCLFTARTVGRPEHPVRNGAIAGIIAGLVALMNPATALATGLWTLWILWARRIPLKRAATYAAAAAIAAGLCLVPWVVRNYRIWGTPVFRTNFGMTLYSSNNDCAQSSLPRNLSANCYPSTHPVGSAAEVELMRTLGEVEYDKRRTADAMAWIRSHPQRFRQLTTQRIVEFWFPAPMALQYPAYFIWLVTLLSAPGLILGIKHRNRITLFLLTLWAFYPLMYYVVVSSDRYRYPILWTSLLPAGYWVASLWRRWIPAR